MILQLKNHTRIDIFKRRKMTVKELINILQQFPENVIVRDFYIDEYGENHG